MEGISYRPFGLVNGCCRSGRADLRAKSIREIVTKLGARRPLANRFNELILIHGSGPNPKLRPAVSHPPILYILTAHVGQILLVVTPAVGVSPRLLAPEIAVISACWPRPIIGVKPSLRAIAICAEE